MERNECVAAVNAFNSKYVAAIYDFLTPLPQLPPYQQAFIDIQRNIVDFIENANETVNKNDACYFIEVKHINFFIFNITYLTVISLMYLIP